MELLKTANFNAYKDYNAKFIYATYIVHPFNVRNRAYSQIRVTQMAKHVSRVE